MLMDKVRKYYAPEYDLNCAETILYAANEEYDMNLTIQTLKSASAFGGGMGVEGVCGAVSGALIVIGILYTNEKAHESEKVKELSKEFINTFEMEMGTSNCKELKEKYRNDQVRCYTIVKKAAQILDGIVLNAML